MKISKFLYFALSFSILIFAFSILPVKADSTDDRIAELRKQIEALTKEAEQYRGAVLEKHKEADTLKRQIDILNNQILGLQAQIGATESGITETKLEINSLEGQLFQTQKSINQQRFP